MKMFIKGLNRGILAQCFASFAAIFSVVVTNVNYSWPTPYVPKLMSNTSEIPATSEELSWCITLPIIFEVFGAYIGSLVFDRIGRKLPILLTSPFTIILLILLAYSKSIWQITLIRSCIGLADGLIFSILPSYIAEICEPNIRGFFTTLISPLCIIGSLIVYIIGPQMTIFESSMFTIIFPVIQILLFILVPDSPYYYIKKGQINNAEKSLRFFTGRYDVQNKLDDLSKAVKRQEEIKSVKYKDLFMVPSNRRASLIFLTSCFAAKLSGRAPISFYSQIIFQQTGSLTSPEMSVIYLGIIELLTNLVVIYFVDKIGKKILIMTSIIGCALFILILDIYLLFSHKDQEAIFWIPFLSILCFIIFYNVGLSFLPLCFLGEIFPTNIKGKAQSTGIIVSELSTVLVTKFYQITSDRFGIETPLTIFFFCSIVISILTYRIVPETKGKTLEEIQIYLMKKSEKRKCNFIK